MTDEEVHALESVACPGAGACGGQFTANTMAMALDFLGVSAPRPERASPRTIRASRRPRCARASSRCSSSSTDTRPSQILTREAFENAIAAIAGTGGSTNGVLHLLAIARRGGRRARDRRLRHDLRAHADRRRHQAGRPLRRHRPLQGRRRRRSSRASWSRAGVVHEDARGVDGRSLARGRGRRRTRRPGQEVVVSWDDPLKPTGGLAILRGNLAPEGCVVKLAGPRAAAPPRARARLRLGGGLLRRRQGARDRAGRRRRDPLRGPGGRPGHARDAARDRRARRRGARRRGGADHRRPLLGRDARPDGRPHRARGVPRRPDRAVRDGDRS